MKEVAGGKAANITLRCTEELKQQVEQLRAARFPTLTLNQVLGLLIKKGADIEERREARDRELEEIDAGKPARPDRQADSA